MPGCWEVVSDPDRQTGKTLEHSLGHYYIQSLSSMIPPLVLNPQPGEKVLDLCAAPGSKSTQLAALMQNKGFLALNEIQADRVRILTYNAERMNLVNSGVIHQRAEWLANEFIEYFDKILVDAPCSGLGILSKKDEVNNWWNQNNVTKLAALQNQILISAIKMLKPGGEIVYSTCTMTYEENEELITRILEKYPVKLEEVELPLKSAPGISEFDGRVSSSEISMTKRLLPWEILSEGFYIARLRKTGSVPLPGKYVRPKPFPDFIKKNQYKKALDSLARHFGMPEDIFERYSFNLKGNKLYFSVNTDNQFVPSVFQRIGLKFATIDKKGDAVLHSLAAQHLDKYITASVIDLEDVAKAKVYLEGGTVQQTAVNNDDISGSERQVAVRYNGLMLGTAVMTRQGLKSQFPKAHRIQNFTVR